MKEAVRYIKENMGNKVERYEGVWVGVVETGW